MWSTRPPTRRLQARAPTRAPTPTRLNTRTAGGEPAPAGRTDAAGDEVRACRGGVSMRIEGGTGDSPVSAPVRTERVDGLEKLGRSLAGDVVSKGAAAGAGTEGDAASGTDAGRAPVWAQGCLSTGPSAWAVDGTATAARATRAKSRRRISRPSARGPRGERAATR